MSSRSLLACLALLAAAAAAAAATWPGGVGLGGQCTHHNNCSAAYSFCNGSRCECREWFEFNGTNCTLKLNARCDPERPCARAGAECRNALCVCKQNFVAARGNSSCVSGQHSPGAPFSPPAYGWSVPGASPTSPGGAPINYGASHINPGASPTNYGAPPTNYGGSPVNYGASPTNYGASPTNPGGSAVNYGASPTNYGATPFNPGASPGSPGALPPPAFGAPSGGPGHSGFGMTHGGIPVLDDMEALGQFCSSHSNCTTAHSVCRGGACVCADGYAQANRTCVKKAAAVYDPCARNESCYGLPNTTCINGRCVCLANYFPSPSRRSCERKPCQAGSCSHVGYATCTSSSGAPYCSCNAPDFIHDEAKCYKEIGTIGAKCDEKKSEKCFLNANGLHQHVECKKGKCQCKKNYRADKRNKQCIAGASAAAASALVLALAAALGLRA